MPGGPASATFSSLARWVANSLPSSLWAGETFSPSCRISQWAAVQHEAHLGCQGRAAGRSIGCELVPVQLGLIFGLSAGAVEGVVQPETVGLQGW